MVTAFRTNAPSSFHVYILISVHFFICMFLHSFLHPFVLCAHLSYEGLLRKVNTTHGKKEVFIIRTLHKIFNTSYIHVDGAHLKEKRRCEEGKHIMMS